MSELRFKFRLALPLFSLSFHLFRKVQRARARQPTKSGAEEVFHLCFFFFLSESVHSCLLLSSCLRSLQQLLLPLLHFCMLKQIRFLHCWTFANFESGRSNTNATVSIYKLTLNFLGIFVVSLLCVVTCFYRSKQRKLLF